MLIDRVRIGPGFNQSLDRSQVTSIGSLHQLVILQDESPSLMITRFRFSVEDCRPTFRPNVCLESGLRERVRHLCRSQGEPNCPCTKFESGSRRAIKTAILPSISVKGVGDAPTSGCPSCKCSQYPAGIFIRSSVAIMRIASSNRLASTKAPNRCNVLNGRLIHQFPKRTNRMATGIVKAMWRCQGLLLLKSVDSSPWMSDIRFPLPSDFVAQQVWFAMIFIMSETSPLRRSSSLTGSRWSDR